MSVVAVYFTVWSHSALNGACASLSNALDKSGPIPSCGGLFDLFAPRLAKHYVNASVLFYAFYVCTYATLILWIFLSALMLCRCLLGVDFQRTAVEIKPMSGVSVSMAPTPLIERKEVKK